MGTETKFEDGNLIVTRLYHASIEDVFDAWIETSKLNNGGGVQNARASNRKLSRELAENTTIT